MFKKAIILVLVWGISFTFGCSGGSSSEDVVLDSNYNNGVLVASFESRDGDGNYFISGTVPLPRSITLHSNVIISIYTESSSGTYGSYRYTMVYRDCLYNYDSISYKFSKIVNGSYIVYVIVDTNKNYDSAGEDGEYSADFGDYIGYYNGSDNNPITEEQNAEQIVISDSGKTNCNFGIGRLLY